MKYKLVCIDLDGTLLNSNHEISQYNIDTIKKVREKGAVIAIVTGRRPKSAYRYAKEIGLDIPLISYNGGMIADTESKVIIHSTSLSRDYAKKVIKLWAKTGAPTFAYANTFDDPDVYHENHSEHHQIKRYLAKEGKAVYTQTNLAESLNFDPVCIKTFGFDTDVDKCYSYFEELSNDQVIWLKTRGPNNTAYLEIYPIAARKSFGLKWLSKHYNIPQEQVLAIGDNLNDIDMLEWAGCGVAMGNALPEVKKIADLTTDTCDNDGVGKALEKMLLQ